MDKKIKILIVILFIIVFFVPIYFLTKMDFFSFGVPYGCRKINSLLNAAGIDSCIAKFMIINTKISPDISCIKLSVNNCDTRRSIEIKNECDEDIYIEGKTIKSKYLDCYTPLQSYYFSKEEVSKGSISIFMGNDNFILDFTKQTGNIPSKYDCVSYFAIKNAERIDINCESTVKIGDEMIIPKSKICNFRGTNDFIAIHEEPPSIDTSYNVPGKIGDKDFNIFYTLTKKQCD